MIPVKAVAKAGLTAYQLKQAKDKKDAKKQKQQQKQKEQKDFREMNRQNMKSPNAAEQFKRDVVTDFKSAPRENPYNDIKKQVEEKKPSKTDSTFQKAIKGQQSSIQQNVDSKGMNVGQQNVADNHFEK